MIEIWGRINSLNVQKAMWAVGELDLPHRRHDAGGVWGGLDTELYGRLNPNRLVPTLVDGDLVLWESNAIVRYLAGRYGAAPFWPAGPGERARLDMWMDWATTRQVDALRPVFWQLVRTPMKERDMALISAGVQQLAVCFRLLDEALEGRTYIGGTDFTAGDIPIGVGTYRYFNLPIERPALPNVERWYDRLTERPAFRTHVMVPVT